MKTRLDLLLVARGLVESRTRAQALVRAGRVTVAGQLEDKPGALVPEEAEITVRPDNPYVGRGAHKLIAALDAFGLDLTGAACLDVGASTGGFTDVLLSRGADVVYAVDVGRGQLAWRLRCDSRVVSMERTDIRRVASLPRQVALATLDVSFISLRLVMPSVRPLLAPAGRALCLVKPQFEAGRGQVGRGGVVTDPAVQRAAVATVMARLGADGWTVLDGLPSPILGASGNREFWLMVCLQPPPSGAPTPEQALNRALGAGPASP